MLFTSFQNEMQQQSSIVFLGLFMKWELCSTTQQKMSFQFSISIFCRTWSRWLTFISEILQLGTEKSPPQTIKAALELGQPVARLADQPGIFPHDLQVLMIAP